MDVGRLRTRLAPALLLACAAGCASVFGPTTAASFMRIVETDKDPNARYKAYQKLGQMKVYDDSGQKARAAQLLVSKLDPRREPLASRAVICRTLGELGDPVAREPMIRLCRDSDPLIRAEAYRALGKVGKPEDATVLMQAMALDIDESCKFAAIEALGLMKKVDPRTEAYLVRAIDGNAVPDPRIRYAALQSLRKISGKDLGAKPEPWRAYVLARTGEKIEPAPAMIAGANPNSGTLDPSASMASMPPTAMPAGVQAPPPGVAGGTWNRSISEDAVGADMPYLNNGTASIPPPAPGQKPLPTPPDASPATGGARSVISKVLGY
jgi:hypothetical protein